MLFLNTIEHNILTMIFNRAILIHSFTAKRIHFKAHFVCIQITKFLVVTSEVFLLFKFLPLATTIGLQVLCICPRSNQNDQIPA